jgi:hypothetical protein
MMKYTSISDLAPFHLAFDHEMQMHVIAHGLIALIAMRLVLGRLRLRPPLHSFAVRNRRMRRIGIGVMACILLPGAICCIIRYAALPSLDETASVIVGCLRDIVNSFSVPLYNSCVIEYVAQSYYLWCSPPSIAPCSWDVTASIFVSVFAIDAIPLFVSLLVFRLAGYRVVFRRAAHSEATRDTTVSDDTRALETE